MNIGEAIVIYSTSYNYITLRYIMQVRVPYKMIGSLVMHR
jgi:hypothetical protein